MTDAAERVTIRPQPGPQEAFLASSADIVIYGGAAFGGKTFALLLETTRHSENPQFGAVIFRRTTTQVAAEGGLWDTSEELYPLLGAKPSSLSWAFPSGAKVTFAHLQHEKTKFEWQGGQIAMIGFDELTHFTAGQFWYMLSRNRSNSGVAPYIRATTNPDPDSFVAELIAWWIDQETGYAIPERSGVIRWFVRYRNELIWADSPEELRDQYPDLEPKSLTFIASSYKDNKIGMAKDPKYMSNLDALPLVEREQLKNGNWKIRPAAGDYFKAEWFGVLERAPEYCRWVRYWDRAATEPNPQNPDPDYTAGVKLGKDSEGNYYVGHVARDRKRPAGVMKLIKGTTRADSVRCAAVLEQDPAQAGKVEADMYITQLAGFEVHTVPKRTDKETAARPVSSMAEAGRVFLIRGAWNKAFLDELENFPKGAHDDQVDALSGAFNFLESNNVQPPAGETVEADENTYRPQRPTFVGTPDELRIRRRWNRLYG
ncbi:phage terminase large subunit [Thauera sinica]|uniref:Phage terminase large subunit n=1 Tax=Thauera sinica TaxID=2665146 RepID=A0ABW1ARL3_9RHOO|nr:phage terminase large subunit [Thauera sp. K11]ATE60156.1 terminase [Thauera sp. K11]